LTHKIGSSPKILPALANGLLFVRNSYEVACFDLRVK
jgi:hypothetical protein